MAFALFLLMDPVGNIPLFISILKDLPPGRQFKIILRELIIALGIMVSFNYIGNALLSALHVSQYSLLISGGVILFLLSLKMIFPSDREAAFSSDDKEPFIVPLAIPLIAGPSTLAAIILYSKQQGGSSLFAIICAWAISTLILLSSTFLYKALGKKGILACERLMGLILTMVSIEMFLEGVTAYRHANGT